MTLFKNHPLILLATLFIGLRLFNACNTPSCEQAMPTDMVLNSVNDQNVAMDGYDVTAFFTKNEAILGDANFSSQYNGVTYHFANAEAKMLFDGSPELYLPQFGGFCAVAASANKLEPAQIDLFDVYGGKLYFARNEKAQQMWEKDKDGIKERAERNWPCLVSANGREL